MRGSEISEWGIGIFVTGPNSQMMMPIEDMFTGVEGHISFNK
jgi:hypothetical protein